MIALTSKLDTSGLDRLQTRLVPEMRAAIPHALTYLKELAYQIVVRMGAFDTFALLLSIYISSWGYSEYEDAVTDAADAYAFNDTKYPGIRALNGGNLEVVPEVRPDSPDEGWLAVAAAHGAPVEEGYTSLYGNEVPARPFVQDTAHEGVDIVVREFQNALQRALR